MPWSNPPQNPCIVLTGGNLLATGTTSYRVGMAVDLTNKLVWFMTPGSGFWNGSTTADPASGTGGFSYTTSGAMYPFFAAYGNGGSNEAQQILWFFADGPPALLPVRRQKPVCRVHQIRSSDFRTDRLLRWREPAKCE